MPNLELWYLDANGNLLPSNQQGTNAVLDQQTMPAITTFTTSATASPPNQPTAIASSPYTANQPQPVKLYVNNWPFFANFPFGYIASNLNWFTAEGVPMTTYDDAGRLNSYPLMRVQAKAAPGNALGLSAGTLLATVDTVLPISAEADCKGCHADPGDPNYAAANIDRGEQHREQARRQQPGQLRTGSAGQHAANRGEHRVGVGQEHPAPA